MIYSQIKNINPSKLGLGIMRHDEKDFNNTKSIIDFAFHSGVNYFESCYFYLNNKCESILAKALADYDRNSYYLCGKMPIHGILENHTPREILFEQIVNCNSKYFDIYLLQALDRNAFNLIEKHNLIKFVDDMKKMGYAKLVGFSFHDTPEVLEKYLNMYDWDVVQLQLNYYDWYIGYGKELY